MAAAIFPIRDTIQKCFVGLVLAFSMIACEKQGNESITSGNVPVSHIAPATPPPTQLSIENIELVHTNDGGHSHILAQDTLLQWIREGRELTAEDRDMLLAVVRQPAPEAMQGGEWEERVNEILNLLRSQPGAVPGLADAMLELAEDSPGFVMRMYALQHIAMWIPAEPDEEKRKAMMDYLQRLTWSADDPLAGSAVLFLSDLQRNGSLPEDMSADDLVGRTALRIAADATAAPDVRIAALHACVDQGTAAALPAARRIASDAKEMIPLRKAAIHTVGQFGSAEDVEWLETLAAGEPVLRGATGPAVGRLSDL